MSPARSGPVWSGPVWEKSQIFYLQLDIYSELQIENRTMTSTAQSIERSDDDAHPIGRLVHAWSMVNWRLVDEEGKFYFSMNGRSVTRRLAG
jgi:hypothetical protein